MVEQRWKEVGEEIQQQQDLPRGEQMQRERTSFLNKKFVKSECASERVCRNECKKEESERRVCLFRTGKEEKRCEGVFL